MVQIVEYTVNHTRRDILGTHPVTPTVDLRRVLHTIERGFNVLNKHYDKKKRVSKYSLKWWLHRESNPSYRRERAVSWPLDHGALIKTGNVLLSGSFPPSIIGAKELNYCVRDGNRCDLLAIVTGFSACGFSIWLCCCSHPAVLMYLCTLRSSVLARLVSCKISYAVSCLLNSPITSLLLVLCGTHIL